MTDLATINQSSRIFAEVTPGTNPGTGGRQLATLSMPLKPAGNVDHFKPMGAKFMTVAAPGKEWAEAAVTGQPTYSELAYALSGILVKATPATTNPVASVTVDSGGTSYATAPTVSFTPTSGGTGAAATAVVAGGIITAINMTNGGTGYITAPTVVLTPTSGGTGGAATAVLGVSNVWTFTPNTFAKDVVQTYSIEQGATGNVLKASFGHFTEFGLTADRAKIGATGKMVFQRLDVTPGNTFGTLAGTALSVVPVLPTHQNVYLDTTSGALGGVKLLRAFTTDLKIGGRQLEIWPLDRANSSWAAFVEGDPTFTGELLTGADNTAGQGGTVLFPIMRAGTKMYLRLEWISGTLIETIGATPVYHSLVIDCSVTFGMPTELGDSNGVFALKWPFTLTHDYGWGGGKALSVALTTDLASL